MVILKTLGKYTITAAQEEDYTIVYNILKEEVVGVSGTANSRLRKDRRLQAFLRRGIKYCNTIILMKNGIPIGACIYDDKNRNTIININILKKHRAMLASAALMHYLLITVFNYEEVFYFTDDNAMTSYGEHVKDNLYKVKSDIATKATRFYGEN